MFRRTRKLVSRMLWRRRLGGTASWRPGCLKLRPRCATCAPMDKDPVIEKLRAHEAELRAEGLSHVILFGSVARGEQDEKSDVDLFYDYDSPRFGLFDVMRVTDRLTEILGTRVDAMTRDSVHHRIRKEVETEAIQVF